MLVDFACAQILIFNRYCIFFPSSWIHFLLSFKTVESRCKIVLPLHICDTIFVPYIYSKINIILFSRNSVVESLNVCVVWIRISIEIWIIFEFNLNRHVKFFFFFDRFKNTSRTCTVSLMFLPSSRIYLQIRAEKLFQMANLLIAAEINFGSYRLISQKNCTWKPPFLHPYRAFRYIPKE